MSEPIERLWGIPNLMVTGRTEHNNRIEIEVETIEQTYHCCLAQRLVKWSPREKRRKVNDTHLGGFPVLLNLKVKRAKCNGCGKKGVQEYFDFIQPERHMTKRLFNYIARETVVVGRNQSATGRHTYMSEGVARSIAHQYIDRHVKKLERPTPRVLGIDEKRFGRIFRAVLGNIEERTVLDMLPDREASLEQFLRDIENPEKIEVVCIDQFDGYRTMVKRILPGRAVVTDRFHVVRKANESLDRIRAGIASRLRSEEDKQTAARLRMSKKLFGCRSSDLDDDGKKAIERWSQRFPLLAKAYWAKEEFFDMYDYCHTPGEAEIYHRQWAAKLDPEIAGQFYSLANIQKRWLPHVFAYFEHPFTTGYVESVNRGLKAMQAEGRRFSFASMRGRLMLAEALEKKTFRDRNPGKATWVANGDYGPSIVEHNWGIDIERMNKALTSYSFLFPRLPDGSWGPKIVQPRGLSTIQPVWDEAA